MADVINYKVEKAEVENGFKYRININKEPVTYFKFLQLLKKDKIFREFYIDILDAVDFAAYRWETPKLTSGSKDQEFQFVVLQDRSLIGKLNNSAFKEFFDESGVVIFPNLGKDALLVVPCPVGNNDYGHLGAFMSNAAREQKLAFWEQVGIAMLDRLSEKPVWLNTAGAGVPWLHLRLDDRPKYYRYEPYRNTV